MLKNNIEILNIDFREVDSDLQGDPFLCQDWLTNYALKNFAIVATSMVVVTINIIACWLFERMSEFEKKHTVNEQSATQFVRIMVMQYFNIALVIFCVNLNLESI